MEINNTKNCRKYRERNLEKVKAYQKAYYERNKLKIRERAKVHARLHKEDRRKSSAEWKKRNPEKVKNAELKREFGITIDQYNQMLIKQNDCCAICNKHKSLSTKMLAVDHNHKTGQVRELLCHACNTAYGFLNESEDTILKLLTYHKKHHA